MGFSVGYVKYYLMHGNSEKGTLYRDRKKMFTVFSSGFVIPVKNLSSTHSKLRYSEKATQIWPIFQFDSNKGPSLY